MATDANQDQATLDAAAAAAAADAKNKVTFTPEQQEKVNELIRKAMGKAASDVRGELDQTKAEITRLSGELEAARQAAHDPSKSAAARADAKDDASELQRQIDEMKTARQGTMRQLDTMTQQLKSKDDELKTEKANSLSIRKQVAITEAAGASAEFINLDVVRTLTEKFVQWDTTAGKFVVLNEHGQPRMNSAFEEMTMKEYFEEFAEKNPYLVRSGAKPGTGANESSRSVSATNGRFTVEQIFGSKSTPKLANELAKKNMPEYQRLKQEARAKGLIA